MLRTKDVIMIEEETDKNIEDFCDEDYFVAKYGEDYDCDEEQED